MSDHIADIRGHQAWYRTQGDKGPPVLLVQGFGMSGLAWTPQADDLGKDHRTVLYDARGVGRSAPAEGPHDLETLADDAVGLLDHLGWKEAHVVGVSMGGMVSQHIALQHTHRVRSLTLIATSPGPLRANLPGLRGIRLFLNANARKGQARLDALYPLLFPVGKGPVELDASLLEAIASPTAAEVRLSHFRSIATHDTRAHLRRLRSVPTLVVKPSQDVLVPPRANNALADGIPGARLAEFRDAGHGVTVQHPGAVSQLIREHIQRAG